MSPLWPWSLFENSLYVRAVKQGLVLHIYSSLVLEQKIGIKTNFLSLWHSCWHSRISLTIMKHDLLHTPPGMSRMLINACSHSFLSVHLPFPGSHACFSKAGSEREWKSCRLRLPPITRVYHCQSQPSWCHWITVRYDSMKSLNTHTSTSEAACVFVDLQMKQGRKTQREEHEERKLCRMMKNRQHSFCTTTSLWSSFCVGQLTHEHQTVQQAKNINADYWRGLRQR